MFFFVNDVWLVESFKGTLEDGQQFPPTSRATCWGLVLGTPPKNIPSTPLEEVFWMSRDLTISSSNNLLGGGFKHFFIFTPIWERFPIWLIFFRWVETTNQFGFGCILAILLSDFCRDTLPETSSTHLCKQTPESLEIPIGNSPPFLGGELLVLGSICIFGEVTIPLRLLCRVLQIGEFVVFFSDFFLNTTDACSLVWLVSFVTYHFS